MPRFNSPADVQAHFYHAIETGDAEAMMLVWPENEDLVCIHPGAPRLDERELIAQSWQQILVDGPSLSFAFSEEHQLEQPMLAVFTARVEVSLDDEWIDTLTTTNVYRNSDAGWHMVVHHASPDPTFEEADNFDNLTDFEDEDEPDGVVLH